MEAGQRIDRGLGQQPVGLRAQRRAEPDEERHDDDPEVEIGRGIAKHFRAHGIQAETRGAQPNQQQARRDGERGRRTHDRVRHPARDFRVPPRTSRVFDRGAGSPQRLVMGARKFVKSLPVEESAISRQRR